VATKLNVTFNTYVNPYSTTSVSGLKTWYFNSAGTLRAYYQSATLSGLVADGLTAARLTPLSEVVGQAGVSIKWTITLKNTIFSDSVIIIYFPKWNPAAGEFA
jgi:hypothetical protein